MKKYKAKQGDVIWLEFNPGAGHEQSGRRPAVVISNSVANEFLNKRAIVCPISSTNKNYPIQPILDDSMKTKGVVLCDQVMAVDLQARHAEFIENLPNQILQEIVDIVYGMIEI